jgi:transcriptional antiterminator NusG
MAEAKWYAIQSYSGHENKVQRLIQRRIDEEPGEPQEKQIQEVLVPTQEVVEIRNGKRVTVTRKLYPGYVLVKMVSNQRTVNLVNGIQGVIKFLGSGAEPQSLSETSWPRSSGRRRSRWRGRRSQWCSSPSRTGRWWRSPTGRSRSSAAPCRRSTTTRGR